MMSRKIMIKKPAILLLLIVLPLLFLCNKHGKGGHTAAMVKTFQVNNGWGYSIYINNREFVRQVYIPAIEGMAHFNSKDKALSAGNLVLEKIRKHQSPSLRKEELIRLGIVDSLMEIIQE